MSGKPRGDVATITRSVRFMPDEWATVDAEAERRGVSRSDLMRIALRDAGVGTSAQRSQPVGGGRPSQRRRSPFSRESIAQALFRHAQSGAIHHYAPPTEQAHLRRWKVTLVDMEEPLLLSNGEAYALAVGLSAAERRWKQ